MSGTTPAAERFYVLTAVSLFAHRWHAFDLKISNEKRRLLSLVKARGGPRLELFDCEMKSHIVRRPEQRKNHQFFGSLSDDEITNLVNMYFGQLETHNMTIFSVVVDKHKVANYMDTKKVSRKAWECLLQSVEHFMRCKNKKTKAIMITDDCGRQANESLAMKHAHFMSAGTRDGWRLHHILEMPMFVRSELSNGVQLADLCCYPLYKAFKTQNLDCPYLRRILPSVWYPSRKHGSGPHGIYLMPRQSDRVNTWEELERIQAEIDGVRNNDEEEEKK